MLSVDVDINAIRFGKHFAMSFHRTLRVPDDGKVYPLPPGLGTFPLYRVADYGDRLPPEICKIGGCFVPVYQREALWIGFHAPLWRPTAVIVSAGGINTVSGKVDNGELSHNPQNYLVCPDQSWLDGVHSDQGLVRQFVAMPLGLRYTIEASLSNAEALGGIQVAVFEPKPGRFPDSPPPSSDGRAKRYASAGPGSPMGLGAGGAIRQKLYPDPYGIDTWDAGNSARVFIHLFNSAQFFETTGIEPPPTPINAATYTEHGLPWFDLYDEDQPELAPAKSFTALKTIAMRDAERTEGNQREPSLDVPESQINTIKPNKPKHQN